jgi:large repetitive protein
MRLSTRRPVLLLVAFLTAIAIASLSGGRAFNRGSASSVTVTPMAATARQTTAPQNFAAARGPVRTAPIAPFSWTAPFSFTANSLALAPNVTANKIATLLPTGPNGDVNGNGFVNPGDTLLYTVTLTNNGTDPATGVSFTDMLSNQTTLVGGSLTVTPLAVNDSYQTIGNTQLQVAAMQNVFPAVFVNGNVLSNDISPTGAALSASVASPNTSLGGTVTMNPNGTFVYTPPVGQTGVTDTFTYTITAGADTATGTVSIALVNRVWYVQNTAAPGGLGRSGDPFDTLVEAQNASSMGDTIYVFTGDGTTNGQNAGIILKDNQRLIGEGVQLDVPVSVNGGPNPTVLRAAGTAPMIGNAAGNGVSVTNVNGVLIRGLNIAGSDSAIDVTTNSTNSGSVEIANNIIRAATNEGIDVNGGGTGTLTLSIHDNTVTATGNGIDIQRTAGNVNIVAFDDNVVTGNTGGIGINIVGTGATILFDANPGTAPFDTVAGGTTLIGQAGNGVGQSGLVLNNIRGDLSFTDLDIFADNGTALFINGTSPNYTGTSGTRVAVTTGAATLVATNGAAANITDANVNLALNSLTSTNSTVTGVSLTRVSGTFSAPTGSSITNAANQDFLIDGGSNANANVNVTYAGTITDDVGTLVQIQNVTAASTHTFSGAITDGDDGDGSGITLTGNTGATITFNGGLLINTGANAAFTATGGGTVNVCDENPCNPNATGALINTLTTTTATALNVANTNIGANRLEFRSISSNGGSGSGIVLNNTGTSGGLSVKGSGGTCTSAANCTGGAIQNKTVGISLTNTTSPSFDRIFINNTTSSGINGTQVNNFTLTNSTISNTGTSGGAGLENSAVFFATQTAGNEQNLTGVVTITGNTLTAMKHHGISIANFSGTISDANISNNSITSPTTTATSTGTGIQLLTFATNANTKANLTKATINQNQVFNFPSDAGVMVQCQNTVEGSTASTCGIDSSTNAVNITNNTIAGQNPANRIGTQGILFNAGGTVTAFFNVTGNSVTNTVGNAISHNVFGDSVVNSVTSNNTVDPNQPAASIGAAGIAGGIGAAGGYTSNTPTLSWKIENNTVTDTDGSGIRVLAGVDDTDGTLNVTIRNNNVEQPGGNTQGIRVAHNGNANADSNICLDISGNTSAGPPGFMGIGLRKAGTSTTTDIFGIEGLPDPAPVGEGSPAVENYVNSQNPAGGGTLLISATSGFTSCGSAPNLAGGRDSAAPHSDAKQAKTFLPRATVDSHPGDSVEGKLDPLIQPLITEPTQSITPEASEKKDGAYMPQSSPAGKSSWTGYLNAAISYGLAYSLHLSNGKQLWRPALSAFATSMGYVNSLTLFEGTVAAAATPDAKPAAEDETNKSTLIPGSIAHAAAFGATPVAAHRAGVINAVSAADITVNGTGSGFTLPAGRTVTITYRATVNANTTATSVTNTAQVSGTNFTTQNFSATTNVFQPVTVAKIFNPAAIFSGGTSAVTVTLTNPNSVNQTGASFSDMLTNMSAVAGGVGGTCAGTTPNILAAGATNLSFSGITVPGSGSCTVIFNVTSTTVGTNPNATSAVTTQQAPSGGMGSATANLTVYNLPTISKTFTPTSIASGGTSTVTLTLGNTNATNFTNASFTDMLTNMSAVASAVGGTCAGTTPNSLAAGATNLSFSGITIPANSSCTVIFDVTSNSPGARNNQTSGVTVAEAAGASNPSNTATLNVFGPPTISKSFAASPIVVGQSTTLNIVVGNPASNPGNLTGIQFTDNLPSGITATPGTPSLCGGTVTITSNSVVLNGGSLAPNTTCTIPVTVTGVTAVGSPFTNTISSVSSTNGGTNNAPGVGATANITVNKASTTAAITDDTPDPSVVGQPYAVTAAVSVTAPGSATPTAPTGTITVSDGTGGTCTIMLPATSCNLTSTSAGAKNLTATYNGDANFNASPASPSTTHQVNKADTTTTITSDNPDPSSPGASVTVNFTVVANAPGAGTPTGDVTITVSGGAETCTGTVAAGSCNITLTATGSRTLTATYAGDSNFNGSTDTEPHTVITPLTLAKSFTPTQIKVGETSVMSFTITNNNPGSASGISFSDTFPAGIEVDNTGYTLINTCGGSFNPALVNGATSFTYQGGALAGGGATCNITLQVKATSAGLKDNTTGPISSTEGGTGQTSNTATLTVVGAPTLTKAFTPPTVTVGQTSSLGFTITNSNTTVALNNISFTDTLPAGMTVATSGPTPTCGGTLSTTAPNTISFTGGTLAAGNPNPTTCSFSVTVTTTMPGMLVNTTGAISATESGPGGTATATLTVNKANTTTAITDDTPDPSVTGQPYTVTAALGINPPNPIAATGTITVSDGTGGSCVITLPANSCNLTSTTAGAKTLTAIYSGDSNYNGSTSTGVPHQVNQANTTATITSDMPDPSVVGQSVTVAYSVAVTSPGAGTPTGNVMVTDGVNSCTGTVAAGQCVITLFTPGARTLTATYQGDANFNASPASAGASHQVNKADTTTTITADNPDSSIVGQSVTVNFTVVTNAPGSGTPTGNVVVTVSGGAETCTGTVAAGSCNITLTATGNRTLTATYQGDASYNGSSDTEPHQVTLANTTTAITGDSPDPSVTGQGYTVTYTVTPVAPAMGTPTGNVMVSDGTNSCTGTVAAGQCTLSSLTVGAKTLTATYVGDSNFNGSTSTGVAHQVNKANTTTTITADTPDPSTCTQSVTVTYSVAVTAPGAGTPTGNVMVSDGVNSCTGTVAAGQCALTLATVGNRTLTANYVGDGNFNTSTSVGVQHQVTDTTPPVITCPANQVGVTNINAPTTAVPVNYPTPTVTDACGTPAVMCNPPSGSNFAPGVTTVTCTATDAGNNTASCTFTVSVRQPRAAITNLIARVQTYVPPLTQAQANQLKGHLELANTRVEQGQIAQACTHMQNFVTQVNAFTPSPLSATQAQDLISYANKIRNALNCTGGPFATFRAQTVGLYLAQKGEFKLKNGLVSGPAEFSEQGGEPEDQPVAGDWDGDGIDTVGVYRQGVFYLRNTGGLAAAPDQEEGRLNKRAAEVVVAFGQAGDVPIVGDWNGDGIDTIGVFRQGQFLLRNTNTAGAPELIINLGQAGDIPLAGDWDGDGLTTVGIYQPASGVFQLRNGWTEGASDVLVLWGGVDYLPIVGDWDGDGITTVGLYSRRGEFLLRNTNAAGPAEFSFTLGVEWGLPLVGDWDGLP